MKELNPESVQINFYRHQTPDCWIKLVQKGVSTRELKVLGQVLVLQSMF